MVKCQVHKTGLEIVITLQGVLKISHYQEFSVNHIKTASEARFCIKCAMCELICDVVSYCIRSYDTG